MFSLHDPDPEDEQERCPVVVSLAQKINARGQEWSIGFRVYKVSHLERNIGGIKRLLIKVNTDDVTVSIKENPSVSLANCMILEIDKSYFSR